MTPPLRALAPAALAGCLLAWACASSPPPPVAGGGGDPLLGRAALRLFISPAGEPFHGAPEAAYPVAVWFAAADTDHDGRLTLKEFRADAARFFAELDTDHDGVIDGIELDRYEQVVAPEIQPRVGGLRADEGVDTSLSLPGERASHRTVRGGGRPGKEEAGDRRSEGAGLYGLLDEPEPVAASDTDFNGKITLAEFLAAADRRFGLLDKGGRGYLTLDALPKTPAQIAGERAAARRAKQKGS